MLLDNGKGDKGLGAAASKCRLGPIRFGAQRPNTERSQVTR